MANGFYHVLTNLSEILADPLRFLDDLASEMHTGIGAVVRIAAQALDLLLQPRDPGG